MDLSVLSVNIPHYEEIQNETGGFTVKYIINVVYDKLKWTVARRFSEFVTLNSDLQNEEYTLLPQLPSKSLFGFAYDRQSILTRKNSLELYLHELLVRPDLRTSTPVLDFLFFSEKTCFDVRSLKPQLISSEFESFRFSISNFCYNQEDKMLFVGHEDITGMSRLGRVWNIVELDEIGSLSILTHLDDLPYKLTVVHKKKCHFKIRCVHYDSTLRKIFAGLDDGRIAMYTLPTESFVLKPEGFLSVHTGAVVDMYSAFNKILSVGFDKSMRIIDVQTSQIISGGRLKKRLSGGVITTCCMDPNNGKLAFVGSTLGEVLVYKIDDNPPLFLHNLKISFDEAINAICINAKYMFIAHGNTVSCFIYDIDELCNVNRSNSFMNEKNFIKTAQFTVPDNNFWKINTIKCIACDTSNKRLLAGVNSSIVCWNISNGKCICAYRAHCNDVVQITPIKNTDLVITGGMEGSIKVWKYASMNEFTFWKPLKTFESKDGSAKKKKEIPKKEELDFEASLFDNDFFPIKEKKVEGFSATTCRNSLNALSNNIYSLKSLVNSIGGGSSTSQPSSCIGFSSGSCSTDKRENAYDQTSAFMEAEQDEDNIEKNYHHKLLAVSAIRESGLEQQKNVRHEFGREKNKTSQTSRNHGTITNMTSNKEKRFLLPLKKSSDSDEDEKIKDDLKGAFNAF